MAASLRAVRQRIRAVQSIGKITRAQELIASSRIIRAQQRMRDAEPYARELTRAVEAVVSRTATINHPLTAEPESVTRAAVLVLTSDSGFAGAFNTNVLREEARLLRTLRDRNVEPVPYVCGRKGIGWHRARQIEMAQQYNGFSVRPAVSDATEVTNGLLEAFDKKSEDGGVDEIYIVRTQFVSLEIEESSGEPEGGPLPMYEFEPAPDIVLDRLLPQYVEGRIFYAMLESAASELASRRRAMKAATDNANDLTERLTREANNARQAEITQEISEIVGGANAMADASAESE
jgi:F-type H+-transporting ATPase subunit gamma